VIVFLLVVANIINLGAMGEATRRLLGGPAHLCAVGCALVEEFTDDEDAP
jgi:hypothetical protein